MGFVIRLENLRFASRIGVFDFERLKCNDFEVNVCFSISSDCFKMECLETTVSYADVYAVVESVMSREWLLLESVARTIHDEIRVIWPYACGISVKISKLHPPIPGIHGSCSVEYRE